SSPAIGFSIKRIFSSSTQQLKSCFPQMLPAEKAIFSEASQTQRMEKCRHAPEEKGVFRHGMESQFCNFRITEKRIEKQVSIYINRYLFLLAGMNRKRSQEDCEAVCS